MSEHPWLITNPARHRAVEALEAGDDDLARLGIAVIRLPTGSPWLCDICSAELDQSKPITAWGDHRGPSYALCLSCLPVPPPDDPEAPAFRPCPCAGCSAHR